MKIFLVLFLLLDFSVCYSKELFYKVQNDDQIGIIMLSLGHKYLWTKKGKINQFKRSLTFKSLNKVPVGSLLKIDEQDIIFKKNVIVENEFIQFRKKIKTLSEFEEFLKNEEKSSATTANEQIPIIEEMPAEVRTSSNFIHSMNLYLGAGTFVANNNEKDRQVETTTFSGLQPLIQIKGIYSTDLFGSLSLDLFTKKIINDRFSFPINIDYRVQFVPKWNFTDAFRFAISHSLIKHSYVGKNSTVEVPYEISSNFIGAGIVFPRNDFWFELYFEKAYKGDSRSNEIAQDVSKGFRVDSELVYSFSDKWNVIPGLNYYKVDSDNNEYSFSVFETRLVIAHEFEF